MRRQLGHVNVVLEEAEHAEVGYQIATFENELRVAVDVDLDVLEVNATRPNRVRRIVDIDADILPRLSRTIYASWEWPRSVTVGDCSMRSRY